MESIQIITPLKKEIMSAVAGLCGALFSGIVLYASFVAPDLSDTDRLLIGGFGLAGLIFCVAGLIGSLRTRTVLVANTEGIRVRATSLSRLRSLRWSDIVGFESAEQTIKHTSWWKTKNQFLVIRLKHPEAQASTAEQISAELANRVSPTPNLGMRDPYVVGDVYISEILLSHTIPEHIVMLEKYRESVLQNQSVRTAS